MVGMIARTEDNALQGTLCAIHKPVLHSEIVGEDNASFLGDLESLGETAEDAVVEEHASSLGDALMLSLETCDGYFGFPRERSDFHFIIEFAVALGVLFGGAAEFHDDRGIMEEGALRQRELSLFPLAQPKVIFDGPIEITKPVQNVQETLRAIIISFLSIRLWSCDGLEAVASFEDDNIVEGIVNT